MNSIKKTWEFLSQNLLFFPILKIPHFNDRQHSPHANIHYNNIKKL